VEKHLDSTAINVTGRPLVESLKSAEIYDATVIATYEKPLQPEAGIAVLRGNIAPDGAVIKPAAASADLLIHTGPAVVFESIEDFHQRIDDPDLDVNENSVLVLRGCGPKGYPGMPEVSNMAIPKKLLERGIQDLVRICDGRMSGTAFGTVVLHVSPEAAAGGPLSLIRTGDLIELDVPARTINVKLSDTELAERQPAAAMVDALARPARGWERMYIDHVEQAHLGADLDFLRGSSGSQTPRESH
jgi:dihydroxy-acid dehydratase